MLSKGTSVAEAAERVGYEGNSQFSREYKRLFGEAPATETARMRADAVSVPGQGAGPAEGQQILLHPSTRFFTVLLRGRRGERSTIACR